MNLIICRIQFCKYTRDQCFLSNQWNIHFVHFISIKRLPFNYKSLAGYLLAMLSQAAGVFAMILCALTVVAFMIASAWTFTTFIDDITIELTHLNQINSSNVDQHEKKRQFFIVTQLYSDVKQLRIKWWLIMSTTSAMKWNSKSQNK